MALGLKCFRFAGMLVSLRQLDLSSLPAEECPLCQDSISEVHCLNRYILDYCDTLWRNRAFSSQELHTVYRLVSANAAEMDTDQASDKLSLAKTPGLCGICLQLPQNGECARIPQTLRGDF